MFLFKAHSHYMFLYFVERRNDDDDDDDNDKIS